MVSYSFGKVADTKESFEILVKKVEEGVFDKFLNNFNYTKEKLLESKDQLDVVETNKFFLDDEIFLDDLMTDEYQTLKDEIREKEESMMVLTGCSTMINDELLAVYLWSTEVPNLLLSVGFEFVPNGENELREPEFFCVPVK